MLDVVRPTQVELEQPAQRYRYQAVTQIEEQGDDAAGPWRQSPSPV